jgi:hypothetical protein
MGEISVRLDETVREAVGKKVIRMLGELNC